MDSTFSRCLKEDGYQRRSAALLAAVRRRPAVPTVIATDWLSSTEDLGHLYFVSTVTTGPKNFTLRRSCEIAKDCSRAGRMLNYLICAYRIVLSNIAKCCHRGFSNEVPILLFVPMTYILAHYSGLVIRGSADDQTDVWTVALTEYVFMSGSMLVINVQNGVCLSYYTSNSRSESLNDSLLFSLPDTILNAFNYFGRYQFALRMKTDPIMTAMEFYRYGEADWGITAVRNWFVS